MVTIRSTEREAGLLEEHVHLTGGLSQPAQQDILKFPAQGYYPGQPLPISAVYEGTQREDQAHPGGRGKGRVALQNLDHKHHAVGTSFVVVY